ncbi:MAG: PQQ-dependent sugar dehydrogenase [Vicinamibacterales bacterium]
MWKTAVLALVLAQATAQSCDPQPSTPSTGGSTSTPAPAADFQVLATTDTITAGDGVRFRVETIATNLQIPWSLNFAPDGRLFVTERPGRVRILAPGSAFTTALTLDDVYTESEAGLLGLALDPDFAATRLVYLYYTARTASGPVNRIVRYREAGGVLGEAAVLLDGIPGHPIHDGGRLRFGPDGYLYATTGDAAVTGRSQDLASLAGKILRIARDGSTPRDNPYSSPLFSLGHRNPQGLDWHPVTGALYADEHGETGNDEVNLIEAGANYGWPTIQGAATRPDMRTPLTFYSPSVAPSGSSFYRGTRLPGFTNDLFVAALRGTRLLRLKVSGAQVPSQEALLTGTFGRLRDVVSAPDGYLYFCTNNRDGRGSPVATDDRILRIVPAS